MLSADWIVRTSCTLTKSLKDHDVFSAITREQQESCMLELSRHIQHYLRREHNGEREAHETSAR